LITYLKISLILFFGRIGRSNILEHVEAVGTSFEDFAILNLGVSLLNPPTGGLLRDVTKNNNFSLSFVSNSSKISQKFCKASDSVFLDKIQLGSKNK
jgi:hypothetical protein